MGADGRTETLLGVDPGHDPGRRVESHQASRVDQRDAIGEPLGLLHEMGHQDDRHATGPDVLDELPRVAPSLRVEAGRELVEIAIFGLPISASAIESRCFSPPDSFPNADLRFSASPRSSSSLAPSRGFE